MIRKVGRALERSATALFIGFIHLYQWAISPFFGPACRFEPTCSRYMTEAVRKYGILLGSRKGLARILRCHPWHPGGYDPP